MPLLYEKAASAAKVKHGMSVQCEATHFLNPGPIPVTVFDAPLLLWPRWYNECGSVHTVRACMWL